MNTLGIIAEYNPFHKGHEYSIRRLKEACGADYTVIIMSGDFTQRGCPAILDKYLRAEMALRSGADLVLELPIYYSTGSAEYFAGGAVSILNGLGCIDYLGFGSESGDIASIENIAACLTEKNDELDEIISRKIKSGSSYALARSEALSHLTGISSCFLSTSNDILGIEYVKALKLQNSSIRPICIKRQGAGFHDLDTSSDEFPSAEMIRTQLEQKFAINSSPCAISASADKYDLLKELSPYLPNSALSAIENCTQMQMPLIKLDDFSEFLKYRLLSEKAKGYEEYVDMNSSLSDKILNNLYSFTDISAFIDRLKTKNLTYTRINRALLHILLGLTDDKLNKYHPSKESYTGYARILGLNTKSSALMKKIQECSSIPVISKLSSSKKQLSDTEFCLLSDTIDAADIYNLVSSKKPISEYTKRIILL